MHTQPTAMQSVAEKEKCVIQVRNKLPGINFIFFFPGSRELFQGNLISALAANSAGCLWKAVLSVPGSNCVNHPFLNNCI